MENAAMIVIIIEGVLLAAILIALVAVLISIRNIMILLNEKIDPVLAAIESFASDLNEQTAKSKVPGFFGKLQTLYKYMSVIPSVIKEQKQKHDDEL